MTRPFGIVEQIGLIAGLRWRLLANSLRTNKAQWDLLAGILVGLFAAFFAVAGTVGLFFAGRMFVQTGRTQLISLPLWPILILWLTLPILVGAFRAEFDFRGLLRFPLRYPAFYLLSLAYGLLDFAAVISVCWLSGYTAGMIAARPGLWWWTLVVMGSYILVCLLIVRFLYSWLERLLSTRRGREKFFFLFILAMISLQFLGPLMERMGPQLKLLAPVLLNLSAAFPPGLAGRALHAAFSARLFAFSPALPWLLALAGYGVVAGLLLHHRLRVQYRGEDVSEAVAPSTAPLAAPAPTESIAGSLFSGFRDPLGALLEKEFRYTFRNGVTLLNLLIPPLIVFAMGIGRGERRKHSEIFASGSEFTYPTAVAYALFIVLITCYNSLAYEARGVQFFLQAPIRFREVMRAKNLLLAATAFVEAALLWCLVALLFSPPSLATTAATWALMLFVILVNLSVGNVLSLFSPRPFDYGSFRQRQAGTTMLAALVTQIVVGISCAAVLYWSRRAGSMWFAAGVFLILGAFFAPIYWYVLNYCSQLAANRRETLTAELCK